jgi:hypothetical protein
MTAKHPAKFQHQLLAVGISMAEKHGLPQGAILIDPFAGVGTVHNLRAWGYHTIGVEIEPEWANEREGTIVGDATDLHMFGDGDVDGFFTSPCYGNRMADQTVDAKGWTRNTYRMALGRTPSSRSSAALQWGDAYRNLHRLAWTELTRVCKPGAIGILNCKDHQRYGAVQPVTAWHQWTLGRLGWTWIDAQRVEAPGYRRGENREARLPFEWLIAMRYDGAGSRPHGGWHRAPEEDPDG